MIGEIGLKVLESCLSDDWQSIDDVKGKLIGITRSTVAYGLSTLHAMGRAERRLNPNRTTRTWQYRLVLPEVSECRQ